MKDKSSTVSNTMRQVVKSIISSEYSSITKIQKAKESRLPLMKFVKRLIVLDKDEVVCYFHIDHKKSELDSFTVITSSETDNSVKQIMDEAGFQLTHKDNYSKTSFCTYKPNRVVLDRRNQTAICQYSKNRDSRNATQAFKLVRYSIEYFHILEFISSLFLLVKNRRKMLKKSKK
jgi:hypothetical protein